jgi:hypothetical protein
VADAKRWSAPVLTNTHNYFLRRLTLETLPPPLATPHSRLSIPQYTQLSRPRDENWLDFVCVCCFLFFLAKHRQFFFSTLNFDFTLYYLPIYLEETGGREIDWFLRLPSVCHLLFSFPLWPSNQPANYKKNNIWTTDSETKKIRRRKMGKNNNNNRTHTQKFSF